MSHHDKIYDELLNHIQVIKKLKNKKNKEKRIQEHKRINRIYHEYLIEICKQYVKYVDDNKLRFPNNEQKPEYGHLKHIINMINITPDMIFLSENHINEVIQNIVKSGFRCHLANLKMYIVEGTIFPDHPDRKDTIRKIKVKESYMVYKLLISNILCFTFDNMNLKIYHNKHSYVRDTIEIFYEKAFSLIILTLFYPPRELSVLNDIKRSSIYDRNIWRLIIKLLHSQ